MILHCNIKLLVSEYLIPARGLKRVKAIYKALHCKVSEYLIPARGLKLFGHRDAKQAQTVSEYLIPARGLKPYYPHVCIILLTFPNI